MRYSLLVLIPLFPAFKCELHSQNHVTPTPYKPKDISLKQKFEFYRCDKKGKAYWLKSGANVRIYCNDSILPYSFNTSTHSPRTVYARLYSKDDSTLLLYGVHTNAVYNYKGAEGYIQKTVSFALPYDSIIGIKTKDIKDIFFDKPRTFARVMLECLPLAIIGFVVAPLASINVDKGTVNSGLYEGILYPSIGFVVVDFFVFAYEFGHSSPALKLKTSP